MQNKRFNVERHLMRVSGVVPGLSVFRMNLMTELPVTRHPV
jgi:hypothetical protein